MRKAFRPGSPEQFLGFCGFQAKKTCLSRSLEVVWNVPGCGRRVLKSQGLDSHFFGLAGLGFA